MLELIDVSKVYRGGKRAVDNMTLRLGPGLLGLLGPNGAGKSSLMRMAATITRPTSGRILFDGVDTVARPNTLREVLGCLPQDFGVYPHLNAREFLSYLAAAKGISARATPAHASTSCSNSSTSPRRPDAPWADTPAACCAGWASRRPCSPTPGSSSSTSRPPASTLRSGRASATCSANWPPTGW